MYEFCDLIELKNFREEDCEETTRVISLHENSELHKLVPLPIILLKSVSMSSLSSATNVIWILLYVLHSFEYG